MPKLRLNDKVAKEAAIPPSGSDDVEYWDTELAGFGLRVTGRGKRVWVVRYRVGTRQRRVTLGTTAEVSAAAARLEARRILAGAGLGNDEALTIKARKVEASKPAALTLLSLANLYLDQAKSRLRARTLDEATRHLLKHAKPLHEEEVAAVSMKQLAGLLAKVESTSGPTAANRLRATLSACFAWAMKEGLADANPVVGTRKRPENSRDRVLGRHELARIWRACREDDYGRIVRLLILTGQRRDEVGGMRWSELDLDQSVWRLPGNRTKNRRPHDVPLSAAARAIFDGVPRRAVAAETGYMGDPHALLDRDLLFGEADGPFSGWSKCKERLDQRIARAGAEERLGRPLRRDEEPLPVDALPVWTLHDLRRTLATGMGEHIGVPPHVVEAVLNHVSGHKAGVAGIYNRAAYAKEKRQALDAWAVFVTSLTEGS